MGRILYREKINIPGLVASYEEAVAIGGEIFRLESALGALKEKLKEYVQKNGPVTVGKRQFILSPSQYWTFNGDGLQKAFDRMKKEGIDPFSVVSLAAKGLKKLQWSESDIKALGGTRKTVVNFKDVSVN